MKNVAPNSVSGRVVKTVTSARRRVARRSAPHGAGPAPSPAVPRRDGEDHVGAGRLADPVALHGEHPLGPRLQLVEVLQQPLGVVGDAEEPLRQLLGLHQAVAALARPFDDLLVGQHGLARRTPVDRRFLLVGETLLVQLQEEPLRPLVVLGPAGDHLPGPVDGHAQPAQLPVDGGDGLFGELGRWLPGLDGHVLGVEAEGVVAHGMEHALALVAAEAGDDVAHGVVLDVPHVGAARRIGEHLEHVGGVGALARRSRDPPGARLAGVGPPPGWGRRRSPALPRPSATWSRSAPDRTCAPSAVLPPVLGQAWPRSATSSGQPFADPLFQPRSRAAKSCITDHRHEHPLHARTRSEGNRGLQRSKQRRYQRSREFRSTGTP